MSRTILVHLNIEVPDDDRRSAEQIGANVEAALNISSDEPSRREENVEVALAEEI